MSPSLDCDSALKKATKYLVDNGCICEETKIFCKPPRYIPLRSSHMFASLVGLYASQFRAQWHHFKDMVESFNIPTGIHGSTYIARILLSHWLIDVYVSNTKAVYELCALGFSDHFAHHEVVQSVEYDAFLVLLHASLRPTNIKGAIGGHVTYIPLMAETVDWTNSANPFDIAGFTLDSNLFHAILFIMKGLWIMTPVVDDAAGGPCWLFDWHGKDEVCTWFPLEGNFSMDDVTLAYIVGVGCTPNLGPRDVDDWQNFPGCVQPAHLNPREFQRLDARRFYGSYEVRSIETRIRSIDLNLNGATDSSRKRRFEMAVCSTAGAETSTSECQIRKSSGKAITVTAPQYQLADWCYYARVIIDWDNVSRSQAHCLISIAY